MFCQAKRQSGDIWFLLPVSDSFVSAFKFTTNPRQEDEHFLCKKGVKKDQKERRTEGKIERQEKTESVEFFRIMNSIVCPMRHAFCPEDHSN